MIKKGPAFNSKILLFGEYSLIKGSMALSIPNSKLDGQLFFDKSCKGKKSTHYSVAYLVEYLDFLKKNNFHNLLNINQFNEDIDSGLFFECNIPISYGLGSSGAIVASIFNAYSNKNAITDFSELKAIFSKLESFYHGESSGLDPLVSYLNKAVLIDEKGVINTVELPKTNQNNKSGIFLVDTKTTGETQPLVNWFLNEYEKEDYKRKIQNQLIPLNNSGINSYLNGDYSTLLDNVKNISDFTLKYFKPMIPDTVNDIWKNGLLNDKYYLKLCGSGGGGMMLGFSKNIDSSIHELSDFKTHVITRF